jgi:3-isopropylmalate/(R)-2-methylmalate dehydratase large subunit
VNQSLLNRSVSKRPDRVKLQGRILFLTEDPELIKRQLAGEDLPWDTAHPERNPKLRDDISTDEITPAHICFFFDETLGEFPYTGLKCGDETPIKRMDVKRGGFVAAVSGKRRGKGSSREASPYAEMNAGIQLVIAENIERIYKQNCQNLGVLTSTDFSLIDKIRGGKRSPLPSSPKAKMRSHARSSSTAACSLLTLRACRARYFCLRSKPGPAP